MLLEFGDRNINVEAKEKESITSISTGKQLYKYSIKVDVRGKKLLDNFQMLIKKYGKENLNELDTADNVIRTFRITNSQYSYNGMGSDEDTIYHYTLEISEYEELLTSVLTIADVDCEVISYDETVDKSTNAIVIDAIIKQTEEDRDKINSNIDKHRYFNVVRKDICDDVLKMRFGKTIWSKHDGYIKRKIVLVQEQYDDGDRKSKLLSLGLHEPEIINIQKLLAKQMKYTALLEDLLINKGIISDADIARIKLIVEDTYLDNFRDYYIVNDVEKYD